MKNIISVTTLKCVLFAAILFCRVTSAHAQSDWINIAVSADNNIQFDVKPGSLEILKTKGGTDIAVVIGRITDTTSSRINLYKWYVSSADCKRQMGKVVSLGIDGNYIFENEFVFGSGSIATSMAESICNAADYWVQKTNEKSL